MKVNKMKIIKNEYKVGDKKLIIEHDIKFNDYTYRVIQLTNFVTIYTSEPFECVIQARSNGFDYMGVQH
jgi:hypothetical protein